ncbi:MAG TPA: SRPBCC domain-containing protein [Planctomycetota bacterium]|nr:SRPBCC domain-containing protein [Planctomycetota bacterium]
MSDGIRISIGLSAPPERVWEALVVPAKFKEWFSSCTAMSIDLRAGGKAVFTGGDDEAAYRSEGTVLDLLEAASFSTPFWRVRIRFGSAPFAGRWSPPRRARA